MQSRTSIASLGRLEGRVARCRAEHLPALLSPTFLRVLVNALSHADAHLHAAARRLLDRLEAHAAAAPDPNSRVSVAVALARCSGGGFDRLTGTRTAAQLLQARGCAGHDMEPLQLLQEGLNCGALSPKAYRSVAFTVAPRLWRLHGCVAVSVKNNLHIFKTGDLFLVAGTQSERGSDVSEALNRNPVQGLDAAGINAYVQHLQALFVHPTPPSDAAAAANAASDAGAEQTAVQGEGGDQGGQGAGEDGEDAGPRARFAPADATRRWAVEQLCGAAALPGAAAGMRARTALWLAAAGLLSLEGAPASKVC